MLSKKKAVVSLCGLTEKVFFSQTQKRKQKETKFNWAGRAWSLIQNEKPIVLFDKTAM
jgi:hypothetical protein